ncbi:hypothetical protein BC940DRAFT_348501 [Gongronella butleri]|nr:hypothetical protein BC940DRAFT_348501 [Gongronella butleri]
MLILRHNTLTPDELFVIERMLLKTKQVQNETLRLDFTLSDKQRADIYGRVLQCFVQLDLFDALGGITASAFLDFLIDVDKGYYPNAYHSFLHAVDVTLVLYYMVHEYEIMDSLSPTDIALLLIAGLCHDIGHPGLNNNYQVNTQSELARQYNNRSVLESHSCSVMIELVEKHQLLRFFDGGSTCDMTQQQAEMHLIQLVLATDMIFHYELQENMTTLLDIIQPPDDSVASSTSSLLSTMAQHQHQQHQQHQHSLSSSLSSATSSSSGSLSSASRLLRDIFSDLGKDSPLLYFLRKQEQQQQQQQHPHAHPPAQQQDIRGAAAPPPSSSSLVTQPSSSAPAAFRSTRPQIDQLPRQHASSSRRPLSSINFASPSSAALPPLPATAEAPLTILSPVQQEDDEEAESSENDKDTSPMEDVEQEVQEPVIISVQEDNPCLKKQKTSHLPGTVTPPPPLLLSASQRLCLCQIILHAADISNPLRPWPLCYTWSERVCVEFFHQGDMERAQGLPLSPNMDRQKTNQLNVGLQFSDFVVSPYFEIFAAVFPKADEMVKLLKSNRREWIKKLNQQGFDVDGAVKKQKSPGSEENEDEDEDDVGDYGCIPAPLVPSGTHILNPTGRRVSVAAGMAVIPNGMEKRTIGTGPRRRVYWGVRSASYADILDPSYRRGSKVTLDELDKSRRKSEQPVPPAAISINVTNAQTHASPSSSPLI